MHNYIDFIKKIVSELEDEYDVRNEYTNFNIALSKDTEISMLENHYFNILQTADEVKYATGGYLVHRGYLSRNIKEPFTVGGCNRGKLLKYRTAKSKVSYEYYFKEKQLVMVKAFIDEDTSTCCLIEFINVVNGIEVGITYEVEHLNDCFKIKNTIKNIMLCRFHEEKLVEIKAFSRDINLYTKEVLKYDHNHLMSVDYVEFGISFRHKLEVIEEDRINFLYNSNEYPCEYYYSSDSEQNTYPISKTNQKFYIETFINF